jgi:hypothetical protein
MAGKTFPGIGELEDESPPSDPADAADSSGDAQFYSGPTVVDEAKVEQGLKKLRSLDGPPGPLTGIHRAIADALDDPRLTPQVTIPGTLMMPEFTIDAVRGTAIGRSVSGPLPGQQTTQPFDDRGLRGTMFGHSVHLPDLDRSSRKQEVETSKALAIVERGVPTTNEIAIFQPGPGYAQHPGPGHAQHPGPGYAQHDDIPLGHDPYLRASRVHVRETPIDLRTLSPRRQLITRVGAAAACVAAIAVAALLWVHSTSEEAETGVRPRATLPATPPPPPLEVPPPATQVTAAPPPAVAPNPAARFIGNDDGDLPPGVVAPHPKAAPKQTLAPPTASAPASPAALAHHAHASATRPDRRHGADARSTGDDGRKLDKGDKPNEAAAPAKPTRGRRPLEDDPDGTMAPTIE